MKLTRFKPTDSGFVRVTLDVTYNDIIKAQHFDSNSTVLRNEDGRTLFALETSATDETKVGKHGFRLQMPRDKAKLDEKVEVVLKLEEPSEAALIGLLVNSKTNLAKVEAQIKEANKTLAEASKEIEEA